jgi:hypothetical protein
MAKNDSELLSLLPRDLRLKLINEYLGTEGRFNLRRSSRAWRNFFNTHDWQHIATQPVITQISILCRLALHLYEIKDHYWEPDTIPQKLAHFCDVYLAYPLLSNTDVAILALTCLAPLRGLTERQRVYWVQGMIDKSPEFADTLLTVVQPQHLPSVNITSPSALFKDLTAPEAGLCTELWRKKGIKNLNRGLVPHLSALTAEKHPSSFRALKVAQWLSLIADPHAQETELQALVHDLEKSPALFNFLKSITNNLDAHLALCLLKLLLKRQAFPEELHYQPDEISKLASRLHASQAKEALPRLLEAICVPLDRLRDAALDAIPVVVRHLDTLVTLEQFAPVIAAISHPEGNTLCAVRNALPSLLEHADAQTCALALEQILPYFETHPISAAIALEKTENFFNPELAQKTAEKLLQLFSMPDHAEIISRSRCFPSGTNPLLASLIDILGTQPPGYERMAQQTTLLAISAAHSGRVSPREIMKLIPLIHSDPHYFILPLLTRVMVGISADGSDTTANTKLQPPAEFEVKNVIQCLLPMIFQSKSWELRLTPMLRPVLTSPQRGALVQALWQAIHETLKQNTLSKNKFVAAKIAVILFPYLSRDCVEAIVPLIFSREHTEESWEWQSLGVSALSAAIDQGALAFHSASPDLLFCVSTRPTFENRIGIRALEIWSKIDFSEHYKDLPVRELAALTAHKNVDLRTLALIQLCRYMPWFSEAQWALVKPDVANALQSLTPETQLNLLQPLTQLLIACPNYPFCRDVVLDVLFQIFTQYINGYVYFYDQSVYSCLMKMASLLKAEQIEAIIDAILDALNPYVRYPSETLAAVAPYVSHHQRARVVGRLINMPQNRQWEPAYSHWIADETVSPLLAPMQALGKGTRQGWDFLFKLTTLSHSPELRFLFSHGPLMECFSHIGVSAGINLRFLTPELRARGGDVINHSNMPYLIIAALPNRHNAPSFTLAEKKREALHLITTYCARVRDRACLDTLEENLQELRKHPDYKELFDKNPRSWRNDTLLGEPCSHTAKQLFEIIEKRRNELRCTQQPAAMNLPEK